MLGALHILWKEGTTETLLLQINSVADGLNSSEWLFPIAECFHITAFAWSIGMIAVVETDEFLADVKGVLSEEEHDALILYVAQYPEAGDRIPDTGGLRKLRWAAKGRGRRGGSRVIYYFHNLEIPLFLMAIFAKNVRADLSPGQRKALMKQLSGMKKDWKEQKPK